MGAPFFDLDKVIAGCCGGDRNCQRQLYEHFYAYGMNICLRYSHDRDEAAEILNQGFFKVLVSISQFDNVRTFRFWLRTILVHAAIDHIRSRYRFSVFEEWNPEMENGMEEMPDPVIEPDLDVLPILQQLSPAYRTVFNLYIMEEYSHREIGEILGISPASSRSNLARAKEQLREILHRTSFTVLKSNKNG